MASAAEIIREAQDRYIGAIQEAIQSLLATKHLYQSLHLDDREESLRNQLVKMITPPPGSTSQQFATRITTNLFTLYWHFTKPHGAVITHPNPRHLYFQLPHIKIHCPNTKCDRDEAHNPFYGYSDLPMEIDGGSLANKPVQWLVLGYECQSCKSHPVIFLVQRFGAKLTLAGRSPIEQVSAPKFIPRSTGMHYSNAIVAHQSGQTLAGNFLLRTFVEQTARNSVEKPEQYTRGVDLMSAYQATLYKTVKEEAPSMREVYEILSGDIHAATGSSDVFDNAINSINRHFEIKKIFEEKNAAAG